MIQETCQSFTSLNFETILLLLGSLNSFALNATLPNLLVSLHINHCLSRQDAVDIKDKGSHRRRRAPEARLYCLSQTSAKLVSAIRNSGISYCH